MERVPERLASCVENSRFSAETILRVNALNYFEIRYSVVDQFSLHTDRIHGCRSTYGNVPLGMLGVNGYADSSCRRNNRQALLEKHAVRIVLMACRARSDAGPYHGDPLVEESLAHQQGGIVSIMGWL